MIDADGFHRNLRGGLSNQAVVANTTNALRFLGLPLTVATYPNGKRLYFLGDAPVSDADKRAITSQIREAFGLVVASEYALSEAFKKVASAMSDEKLQSWRAANEVAQHERNNAKSRDARLAQDPGLAERRVRRLEKAAERRARQEQKTEEAAERRARHERKLEDAAERMSAARRATKSTSPVKRPAAEKKAPAPNRTKWFRSLHWDGRNRIERFLAATAGASPAHSLTFGRALVMAAWRTLEPGARAFSVAFRGVSEAETVAALDSLAGPWLGTGLSAEGVPSAFKNQIKEKLLIHASAHDRRDAATFAILAARDSDCVTEESGEFIKRTFIVCCTLNDDEAVPEGFHEVRVTGFDVEAIRRKRDQIMAEARECAVAAMLKTNPNEAVRKKRIAWQESYNA